MVHGTFPGVSTHPVGQMNANCYFIHHPKSDELLIIDPGDDAEFLSEKIIESERKPVAIVLTHGHFDHVMAAFDLQQIFTVPVRMHRADSFLLDRMVETAKHFLGYEIHGLPPVVQYFDTEEQFFHGSFRITPVHIPGHTPGSVCYMIESINGLFVGDLVFAGGGIGRTDFSYSSMSDLRKSIQKIQSMDKNLIVYPGHDESMFLNEIVVR